MAAPVVIGVDLGGTKILSGVVDRGGNVLRRSETESPDASEDAVVGALDAAVEAVLGNDVRAVGFGVPANLERGSGRILRATNLPFDDFDIHLLPVHSTVCDAPTMGPQKHRGLGLDRLRQQALGPGGQHRQ